jgi:hypothetical protein
MQGGNSGVARVTCFLAVSQLAIQMMEASTQRYPRTNAIIKVKGRNRGERRKIHHVAVVTISRRQRTNGSTSLTNRGSDNGNALLQLRQVYGVCNELFMKKMHVGDQIRRFPLQISDIMPIRSAGVVPTGSASAESYVGNILPPCQCIGV